MYDVIRPMMVIALVLVMTSCAVQRVPVGSGQPCATELFTLIDDFAGARRGDCIRYSKRNASVVITPEDDGYINDSPWYAFKVIPHQPATVGITLVYEGGHHRYWPKSSPDGRTWTLLEPSQVNVSRNGRKAKLKLALGEQPVWIAAQELLLPPEMLAWAEDLAANSTLKLSVLGASTEQHPIPLLQSELATDEVILLVGRQHPPEVTGSFGLFGFVPTLLADNELSNAFRQRFGIVVIPLINPDGVIKGHWRHNVNGVDLNRDWGPFTQPETMLIKNHIDDLVAQGKNIRLFLDFHSTKRNVFYTQADTDLTNPPDFANRWLEAVRPRIQDYPFEHARRHNRGLPTSKNYMFARFGIPAITYEVDDKTTRDSAQRAAVVFAEEMMRIMLESHD